MFINTKYWFWFLLFLVSEYIGGGELLKLLQKYGPLPEELCRIYFAELVVIIGIIHSLINNLYYFQIVNNVLFNIIKK